MGIIKVFLFLIYSATSFAQVERSVSLSWEAVEDSTAYEIQLRPRFEGGESLNFKVKEAKWRSKVPTGIYDLRIRSIDERGVAGEWGQAQDFIVRLPVTKSISPSPRKVIKSQQEKTAEVNFSWQAVDGAGSYRLEIKANDGSFDSDYIANESNLSIQLEVSKKYQWRVHAVSMNDIAGDKNKAWNAFAILGAKLEAPKILSPSSRFVQKVAWQAPPRAKYYSYKLEYHDKKTKQWSLISEDKILKSLIVAHDLSGPEGTYRLSVQAKAPYTLPSDTSVLEYKAKGNLKTEAEIERAKKLEFINRPSDWYGIASYFITYMNYEAKNIDSNIGNSSFSNTLTGTGRIGIGYQASDKRSGYYGVIDHGGFDIDGEIITFSSAELHYTYRQDLDVTGEILWGSGLYYKEMIELSPPSNSSETFGGSTTLSSIGIHAGLSYLRPISRKYGAQFYIRLYTPISGDTPYGGDVDIDPSYLLGSLASYKLRKNLIAYAGYSYRADILSYSATSASDGSSGTNSIEMVGHYLNLKLEYSF